jgi:hypothetical protein
MKNRQFWIIIAILILQSAFILYKFNKVEENQKYIHSTAIFNWKDLAHIIETTDQTLEITAKTANWIY